MPKTAFPAINCKLFLKSKTATEGSVFFLIQKGRKYTYFPGEKCEAKQWNANARGKGKGRAKTGLNNTKYISLNERLDKVESAITEAWQQFGATLTPEIFRVMVDEKLGLQSTYSAVQFLADYPKDPKKAVERLQNEMNQPNRDLVLKFEKAVSENPLIRNIALGRNTNDLPMLKFIPAYLKKRMTAADYNRGTVKNLVTWFVHFSAFCSQYGEHDFDGICNNYQFRERFSEFMFRSQDFTFPFKDGFDFATEFDMPKMLRDFDSEGNYKYKKEASSINHVQKGIEILIQFVNESNRQQGTNFVFHKGFNIKKERTNKVVIYLDEWEQIARTEITDKFLIMTRQRAFAGAFTGMREGDWDKINPNMVKVFDGEKMFEALTDKTGEAVAIPFLPVFEAMLEEINYQLPQMYSSDFNERFKELCRVCGIDDVVEWVSTTGGKRKVEKVPKWQVVSSHVCRRSFATNFTLPPINLSKTVAMQITGHSTEKMFNAYCNYSKRLTAAMVSKEFQRQRERWLFAVERG